MAATVAQFDGVNGTATDPTIVYDSALTNPSVLFVIGYANSTIVGVSDTGSHTWTEQATATNAGGTIKVWTASNTGTTTPTVTFDQGGNFYTLFIGEVVGGTFGDAVAAAQGTGGVSFDSGDTDAASAADSLSVGAVVGFGVDPTLTAPTNELMDLAFNPGVALRSILADGVLASSAVAVCEGTVSGESFRHSVAILFNASGGGGGITGTAAVTLGAFTSSASGTRTVPSFTGTTAVTLNPFVAAASGTRTLPAITGTTAVTLAAFTTAASGTVAGPGAVTGTAAVTLAPFVAAATGTRSLPSFTGAAAVTLNPFLAAATGTVIVAATGTATITLQPFTSLASGAVSLPPIVGTAAITLGPFIASGTQSPFGGTGTGSIVWRDGGTATIASRDGSLATIGAASTGTGEVQQP